ARTGYVFEERYMWHDPGSIKGSVWITAVPCFQKGDASTVTFPESQLSPLSDAAVVAGQLSPELTSQSSPELEPSSFVGVSCADIVESFEHHSFRDRYVRDLRERQAPADSFQQQQAPPPQPQPADSFQQQQAPPPQPQPADSVQQQQ
ncbi:hypothetical protein B484DRAFT_410645, partial [Ochromonadaceae sp. CCMP2298]